jgi:hypothetical protein
VIGVARVAGLALDQPSPVDIAGVVALYALALALILAADIIHKEAYKHAPSWEGTENCNVAIANALIARARVEQAGDSLFNVMVGSGLLWGLTGVFATLAVLRPWLDTIAALPMVDFGSLTIYATVLSTVSMPIVFVTYLGYHSAQTGADQADKSVH